MTMNIFRGGLTDMGTNNKNTCAHKQAFLYIFLYFFGYFDPRNIILRIKMYIFRGELTNTWAKKLH